MTVMVGVGEGVREAGLRVFTPHAELPFAGHATEAWHGLMAVIAHRGEVDWSTEKEPHPALVPVGADPGGVGHQLRIAAAELDCQRQFVRVITQQPVSVAVQQRGREPAIRLYGFADGKEQAAETLDGLIDGLSQASLQEAFRSQSDLGGVPSAIVESRLVPARNGLASVMFLAEVDVVS